ncbi:TM2 domain-containing protein [Mucilaginibacter sp. L196]|uniref:TM2 domain-containing protein n=1 Tax=Mucilaginibacter sp. L196 TaxID=1641870 RepID=UPI00131C53C2|nr:TM2 domain-containing protein [Mucilaginibacter sp. L196]
MDPFQNPYITLPGVTAEEIGFLQQATNGLNENQQKYFFMVYSSKRKNPQDILIFAAIGFFGVAGIQRFAMGQIGMGLLFLFTGGFCGIGTLVDLINHKSLALEYNKRMAYESYHIAQMGGQAGL